MKEKKIYIAPDAVIKGDVSLENGCNVWYKAVIRTEEESIKIGENTNIQDGCILHTDKGYPICIGKNVTVGHGCILHGCTIDEQTIVGMGAIILNGAQIGKNCIIGAGALVTQHTVIPDGMMVLGSPAKIKRALTEDEIKGNLESAMHYVHNAQNYF